MPSIRVKPAAGKEPYRLDVFLNDQLVQDITAEGRPDRVTSVHLRGPASTRLLDLTIGECQEAAFEYLEGLYECDGVSWPVSWQLRQEWMPDDPDAPASPEKAYHYVGYTNTAELQLEPSRWTGLWSIAELVSAMQRVAAGLTPRASIEFLEHEEGLQNLIFVHLPLVTDQSTVLSTLLGLCADYLPRLEAAARAELSRTQDNLSVIQHFHFPSAVSAACQQYLVYFTQFLADLGVEAESEIRSNASEVLFRVFPREGPAALSQVREALDAYLALSSATDVSDLMNEKDIAVTQLIANVEHLRSQLRLARAEAGLYRAQLDARQAQLQAKDLTIQVLRLGPACTPAQPAETGSEPLMDGLITLGKLEKGGVGVDWGVLLRKLRRRFRPERRRG